MPYPPTICKDNSELLLIYGSSKKCSEKEKHLKYAFRSQSIILIYDYSS